MRVTALLVAHNGARWLPQVLTALHEQVESPSRILTVDTGSSDNSPAIIAEALGAAPLSLPSDTGYGAAIRTALETLAADDPDEWIWLLHDDSAPAPHCLQRLKAAATAFGPEVAAVGPKLREWPSLRRLLEVGVTVTGTGRRETGLESGEYDQGQHDEPTRVLAVNTAGMLVRRSVLEEFGFADELPLYANDLDFGWRVAARGLEVHVVPSAVAFHAEAAYRGRRDGELAAHSRRDRRAAEMFVVLTNGSPRAHPIRLVRMFFGSLLRALGFLLVRAFGEAGAELQALGILYGQPRRMNAVRAARQRAATVPASAVRPLLAPWWLPWRHGLDFVVDLIRVIFSIIADYARAWYSERSAEGPLLGQLVRTPATWLLVVVAIVTVVADGGLVHGSGLNGGALLPAPDSPIHWWAQWVRPWHWIGEGTGAAAPAYTLLLAIAGTALLWSANAVLWILFIAVVPLATAFAYRFLARLDGVLPGQPSRRGRLGRFVTVWGAGTYGLLPVLTGALGQGRIGACVTALVLPLVATVLIDMARHEGEGRSRAMWRAIFFIAIVIAFNPPMALAWAAIVALLPIVSRGRLVFDRREEFALYLAPLVLLVVDVVDIVRAPGWLLMEAGRADFATPTPTIWTALTGVATTSAAPTWIVAGLPLAALVGLVRVDTRSAAARAWLVAAVAAVFVAVLSVVPVQMPGLAHAVRPSTGSFAVLQAGALIVAVVIALRGLGSAIAGLSFSWRQPLAGMGILLALVTAVGGLVWWVGGTPGPLTRQSDAQLPAYLTELVSARPDQATLTVSGGPGVPGHPRVEYHVSRDPIFVGDDATFAKGSPSGAVHTAITQIIDGSGATAAQSLADHGVAYVFAPNPVSPDVAGAFDAAPGFESASAPDRGTRVWRVVPPASLKAVGHLGDLLNPLLAALQLLALIALLVLAAPGRRAADR